MPGSQKLQDSAEEKKSVLIYRLGSLGDFIVSLPCLHLISKVYPNARRVLLTNRPINGKAAAAESILRQSGIIDEYLAYRVGTRNPLSLLRLGIKIARLRPDTLIYLAKPRQGHTMERDSLFFRLCGVREIIGIPVGDSAINRYDYKTGLYEPEAARLARCIEKLGDARVDDPASWNLRLSEEEKQEARVLLGPASGERLICCGVGTKQTANDWGVENWRSFLEMLSKAAPVYTLIMLGAANERTVSESAAARWGGKSLNLCGLTTPRQAGAVLSRADIFVGHDSGPMHLTAAVGTPSVSIFSGRNKPGIWFPFGRQNRVIFHKTECSGCGLEHCVKEKKKCILSITPEEVLSAVLSILGARRTTPAGTPASSLEEVSC